MVKMNTNNALIHQKKGGNSYFSVLGQTSSSSSDTSSDSSSSESSSSSSSSVFCLSALFASSILTLGLAAEATALTLTFPVEGFACSSLTSVLPENHQKDDNKGRAVQTFRRTMKAQHIEVTTINNW